MYRPPSAKGILYLAFNQDNTCISIADYKGIKIYSLETHKVLYQSDLGAVRYRCLSNLLPAFLAAMHDVCNACHQVSRPAAV